MTIPSQDFVEPAVIEQAAYILIAIGAFILIISVLGYCGALKESRVLLTAYGIFLIIIFLLQVQTSTNYYVSNKFSRLLPSCCALCTNPKQTTTPNLS